MCEVEVVGYRGAEVVVVARFRVSTTATMPGYAVVSYLGVGWRRVGWQLVMYRGDSGVTRLERHLQDVVRDVQV